MVSVLRVIGGGAVGTTAHRGSAQPLTVCTHQVGAAEKIGVHLTVRVRSSQGNDQDPTRNERGSFHSSV